MTEGLKCITSQKESCSVIWSTPSVKKMHRQAINWKCTKYFNACYGRATTEEIVINVKEHNHPSNEIDVRDILQDIREARTSSQDLTLKILKDILPKVPAHITGQLPSIPTLKRLITCTIKPPAILHIFLEHTRT